MIASKMKSLLATTIGILTTVVYAVAGHPIVMSEERACAGADLVIICRIMEARDLNYDNDPFAKAGDWRAAFTKVASVKVSRVLLGNESGEVRLYGGKLPGKIDYRIMEGEFLVLLKKIGAGAYRAVDWHYSFAPIKDGRVGWLVDDAPNPEKRDWLTPEVVLQRIRDFKTKREQAAAAGSGKPSD